MSKINEEFWKAYENAPTFAGAECEQAALWAAKWMAKRCADIVKENNCSVEHADCCSSIETEDKLRQLSKELDS